MVSERGLVGYWSLNEGTSTQATDSSGFGNTGTLTNMASPSTLTSGWNHGRLGSGLTFDGSNDSVSMVRPANLPTGPMSACMWANWKVGASIQVLIDNNHSTAPRGFVIQDRPDLGGVFQFSVQANDNGAVSTMVGGTGTWKHICGTSDGTTTRLYVNGVLNASDPQTPSNFQPNVTLGVWQGGGRNLNGKLDEVRLYNRALSATEVANLYVQGAQTFQPQTDTGVVGYWSFNEGTSTQAQDSIGEYSGTLTSMASPSTLVSGWNPGRLDGGITCDGTNDYVTMGNATSTNFTNTQGWAISVWINPTKLSGLNTIVSQSLNGGRGWYLNYSADGTAGIVTQGAMFDYWDGSSFNRLRTNNFDIPRHKWTHLVLRKTAGSSAVGAYSIYVNGENKTVPVTAGSPTTINYNGLPLNVCARGNVASFGGKVDELRIFGREISVADIQNLYKAGAQILQVPPSHTGMIGYWSFNEGTSTAAKDYSGNGSNGTLSGFPSPSTVASGWNAGRQGSGLNFDGSNDRINLPAMPSTDGLSQFSVSAWVKRKPNTPTVGGVFIKQTNTSNWLGLQFAATAQLNMIVSNGGLAFGTFNASPVNSFDGWHHFTAVFDGTQTGNAGRLKLYIDGRQTAFTSFTGTIPATTPTISAAGFLGYDQQNNTYLNGSMDEVRVYSRALAPFEVDRLYKSGQVNFR